MSLFPVGLLSATLLLASCQSTTPDTAAPVSGTPPATNPSPAAPPLPAAPRYAGTYAVQDTAICHLTVKIEHQGAGYGFECEGTKGPVEITLDSDSSVYFTLVGLKGQEPEEDISMLWQDSVLLLQNYGNSMNEYTRFGGCDAKYLELRRQ